MSKDFTLREMYTEEVIQARVRTLATEIDACYGQEPVVMVCVLKGGFMFFADLVRHVNIQPQLDFVRLASYGDSTNSNRHVSFTKDVEVSLTGKHVLIVEDIVDSGHSMDFLIRQFSARGAASLRLAAFIDKNERREVDVKVDFAGFALDKGFIVGYGLDWAERYRELPAVYEVEFSQD